MQIVGMINVENNDHIVKGDGIQKKMESVNIKKDTKRKYKDE